MTLRCFSRLLHFRVLYRRQRVRRKLESKLFKLLLRQRAVLVNPPILEIAFETLPVPEWNGAK